MTGTKKEIRMSSRESILKNIKSNKPSLLDLPEIDASIFVDANVDQLAKFKKMKADTDCQLFVRLEHTLQGHDPTPESERGEVKIHREHVTLNSYRRRVLELYDEGAEGIYLFNNSGLGFINELSDQQGLRSWNMFERPLIGWFETEKLAR